MKSGKFLALLGLLVAGPVFGQAEPAPLTVETLQHEIDLFFAEEHGAKLSHYRDDLVKTSILVQEVESSRTPRRCVTEFSTPSVVIKANAKPEKVWRVDWSAVAEIRVYDRFKVELRPKKPDPVRLYVEIPDEELANAFAEAFQLLRDSCSP